MREYDREVNGLVSREHMDSFVNVVNLYKNSRSDIRVYEKVKGTVEAIANIFANSDDEKLKETVCATFDKHGGVFHAKWISDDDIGYDYKARIHLEYMPRNVCKKFISISKWISKSIKNEKRMAKNKEIKLSKLEIQLRKKANVTLLNIFESKRKRAR